MARVAKRVDKRAHDQRAHGRGVAEPHLGLGRMHVDVDLLARHVQKERQHRMPPAGDEIAIGRTHRTRQQLIAHGPCH